MDVYVGEFGGSLVTVDGMARGGAAGLDLPAGFAALGLLLLVRYRSSKWTWTAVPAVVLVSGWAARLSPTDPIAPFALLTVPCLGVACWLHRREFRRARSEPRPVRFALPPAPVPAVVMPKTPSPEPAVLPVVLPPPPPPPARPPVEPRTAAFDMAVERVARLAAASAAGRVGADLTSPELSRLAAAVAADLLTAIRAPHPEEEP